tara:strand:+ start:159 stop:374 length:216 start_codon:yes stop_codon:yes gene_type:complete
VKEFYTLNIEDKIVVILPWSEEVPPTLRDFAYECSSLWAIDVGKYHTRAAGKTEIKKAKPGLRFLIDEGEE